jgi:carboxymethylenebutenolidase
MNDQEIQTETVSLAVSDGTTLPAFVAQPVGNGSTPGLLVFQEAFGVNAHIRDVTQRFARAGYTAIAPALFHRTDPAFEGSYTDFAAVMPHMQALTDEGQSADIQAAFGWLNGPGGAAQIGSVGYCMGGRTSFLADGTVPLAAAVSYYGGGIAPGGRMPSLLVRASDLHGPILLVWGGLDAHIGPEQREAVEGALKLAGKTYAQVTFSDADHAFFCDARASYNPNAARQAWALTLEFLATYMKT